MLYTTPASPTTTPYVSLSSLLRAFSRVYMWHAGGFSTQPFSVGSRQLFIQKPRQKGPMNRQVASYASFCVVSFFFVVCATCHPHQGSVYWTKMTVSRHFRTSPLCEYSGRCCCTEQKDELRNFSKDPIKINVISVITTIPLPSSQHHLRLRVAFHILLP